MWWQYTLARFWKTLRQHFDTVMFMVSVEQMLMAVLGSGRITNSSPWTGVLSCTGLFFIYTNKPGHLNEWLHVGHSDVFNTWCWVYLQFQFPPSTATVHPLDQWFPDRLNLIEVVHLQVQRRVTSSKYFILSITKKDFQLWAHVFECAFY